MINIFGFEMDLKTIVFGLVGGVASIALLNLLWAVCYYLAFGGC